VIVSSPAIIRIACDDGINISPFKIESIENIRIIFMKFRFRKRFRNVCIILKDF